MNALSMVVAVMLAMLPASGAAVSVAYAGSLIRVMEGPLAATLRAQTGLQLAGEGKGSKALVHLIEAGLRSPDVFISADPKLLDPLLAGHEPLISGYAIFGSARMLIAYSTRSAHRDLFENARRRNGSILDVLADPQVQIGRTDPQLDPKGVRTVRVLKLLGAHFHRSDEADHVLAKTQVFPEEDLAVRVESGELDAGFFYSTETPGRGLRTLELPPDANLSHEISYAVALLRHAPNPRAAKVFIDFVLFGGGKTVLEQAGVSYFAHPRIVGRL